MKIVRSTNTNRQNYITDRIIGNDKGAHQRIHVIVWIEYEANMWITKYESHTVQ